jgi:hypothetical protein
MDRKVIFRWVHQLMGQRPRDLHGLKASTNQQDGFHWHLTLPKDIFLQGLDQ